MMVVPMACKVPEDGEQRAFLEKSPVKESWYLQLTLLMLRTGEWWRLSRPPANTGRWPN